MGCLQLSRRVYAKVCTAKRIGDILGTERLVHQGWIMAGETEIIDPVNGRHVERIPGATQQQNMTTTRTVTGGRRADMGRINPQCRRRKQQNGQ